MTAETTPARQCSYSRAAGPSALLAQLTLIELAPVSRTVRRTGQGHTGHCGMLHRLQLSPELEPGHDPPAAPPPAPPHRAARHALEPLCRTELPKISLTSSSASSLHGCSGPRTKPTNARAARVRSARPASVTLSRTASPAITAPALPQPPRPGKPAGHRADAGTCTLSSAANVKPTQRAPRGPRPWLVRGRGPRPWPSEKQPTVRTDRPGGTHARPLCVRGHRNNTPYSATR